MALINELNTYIPFLRERFTGDRGLWTHNLNECKGECVFGVPLLEGNRIQIAIRGTLNIPTIDMDVYSYCLDGSDEENLGTLTNSGIAMYDGYNVLYGELSTTPSCGIRYLKISISVSEVYYSEPIQVYESSTNLHKITLTNSCQIGGVDFGLIFNDSRDTEFDIYLPKETHVGDPRILVEEKFRKNKEGIDKRVSSKKDTVLIFETDFVPHYYYRFLTEVYSVETVTVDLHSDNRLYNSLKTTIQEPEYDGGCYGFVSGEFLVETIISDSCCSNNGLACPEEATREVVSLSDDQTGVEVDDNIGKTYIPNSASLPENPDWQFHLWEYATYEGSGVWTYEIPELYDLITDTVTDLFYYNGTDWTQIDDYVHIDEPTVVGGGCQFTITGFVPVNTWAVVQYSTTGADGTWSDLSSPLTTAEIITGFTTSLLSSPGDHYFRIRAINHNCILDESNIEFVQCV